MSEMTKEEKQEAKRVALLSNFKIPETAVRGKIDLFTPILSRDEEVKVLHYDYSKLTSAELIRCLDVNPTADNSSTLTNEQAMELFFTSCGKCEREISGLDETDIRERIAMQDTLPGLRTAKSFFAHTLAGALLSISKM